MKRIKSLDILRGITVILMIIVNNPGSWDNTFACLKHAAWNGFTITDFVFPSFLFIVGASVWFAFRKYNHSLNANATIKIFKRGILIYVVGILLSIFPFYDFNNGEAIDFNTIRFIGVLPRIGLVYIIGSLLVLCLKSYRNIGIASVLILVSYTLMVYIFGNDTLEGYFGTKIDVMILGETHIYHGYGIPFEPEGLMSTLTSIVTMMLGYISSMIITAKRELIDNIKSLITLGGIMLLTGITLDYFIPINKSIWSASYVIYASGISMILWGVMSYWYDVKKQNSGEAIFNVFGTNALFTYILADLIVITLNIKYLRINDMSIYEHIYSALSNFTTGNIASLLSAITLVFICWLFTFPLYKNKIYIKL